MHVYIVCMHMCVCVCIFVCMCPDYFQMSLIPVGLNNIHFPSNETLQVTNNTERELPPGVNAANKWCYGEVEFEALMRQLDNAVSAPSSANNVFYI